jgi:hypothetical protein
VLARYTCIALQRLSGSAKKVKGKFDLYFQSSDRATNRAEIVL